MIDVYLIARRSVSNRIFFYFSVFFLLHLGIVSAYVFLTNNVPYQFILQSILLLSAIISAWCIRLQIKARKKEKMDLVLNLNEHEEKFRLIHDWMTADKMYLNESMKLEVVAKALHISPRNISGAINKIANENFNSYVNRLRIMEAIRMLKDTYYDNYTMDGIAELCGFSNKVSFYKAFKKVTGMSPMEYKAALKQQKI